ncbi:MAG: hypothetical protein IID51_08015 [Proteobacteria bacterium]|nr:hypothetical protein [Pseudomonadota bacterium]
MYAGAHVITEYDGTTGNLVRRYVYGLVPRGPGGLDDPIVMLDATGTVTCSHARLGRFITAA